jgi:PhnB protein
MSVQPIPAGYHSVTPYLILRDASAAIEFYKQAFNATEIMRLNGPDGSIAHAEIKIGDSPVMMSNECPEMGFSSPASYGGTPVSLMIYVEDCDRVFAQALAAGATEVKPLQDQFYGDRSGTLTDPFGHVWTVATHKEEVSPEEIHKRLAAMMPPAS